MCRGITVVRVSKGEFASKFLQGRAADHHVFVRVVRETEVQSDLLSAPLSFPSTSRRCLRKRSPNLLFVSAMYSFCIKCCMLCRRNLR